MAYVDGFVLPIPTAKRAEYEKVARISAEVFRDHGALKSVECWGDDVPPGEVTSFPMAVKCEPDETVVFSWIMWPSKEVRDDGHQKAMEDPRFEEMMSDMPFDGKRMIFGGFEVMLEG